jgi:hypothetical protein
MQKMPLCAGLLKANTQDFIASVRARFNQSREVLVIVRNRISRTETHRSLEYFSSVKHKRNTVSFALLYGCELYTAFKLL